MKLKYTLAAAFLFVVATAALPAFDQRSNLLPRLRPGQTITYLVRFHSNKRVETESNVTMPLAPNAAQVDAHGLLRMEILDVKQVAGKPVVHAKTQFLAIDSGGQVKEPGDKKPNRDTQRVDPAGKIIEFSISSSGSFENISGLDSLSPEQQQAWQAWASRFAAAWTLPALDAKIGDKWKSEQAEPIPSPIADLAWARDFSYVRNEPCRARVLSLTGEFLPPTGASDTCAVLLTDAKLTQKSSSKDATPKDFKLHELKTMGTAKGNNEIITYISLTTGLVVRATEEANQQMDVIVSKADGANRVHYNVDATSRSEVLLVTEAPLAPR